jgi:TetR/AcrR family transcriptional repressor of nem operon
MTVQVEKKPGTRERILEAARYLFWEKGYGAAGMADILQRADANAGSFYHFFPGKEALLLAVLEDYLKGLEPAILRPAYARRRDPVERIFAILAGYRERLVSTGCRYGCPLGRLALPAHELIARNFGAWVAAVRECLQEARDRFPARTDFGALATLVLTTMEGGVMQSRSARRVEPFDQSVEQLRRYFTLLMDRKGSKR